MSKRITWAIASAAVVASIAVSGTALASGGHAKPHAAHISHAPLSTTAPEPVDSSDAAGAASDPAGPSDQATGPDPAGTVQTETSVEQPSSELTASDGPGGHADEPANANADHQFQGAE